MKILHQGVLPEEKVARITCVFCHTIFEAAIREGTRVIDPRDGDFVNIACPLNGCGRINAADATLFKGIKHVY